MILTRTVHNSIIEVVRMDSPKLRSHKEIKILQVMCLENNYVAIEYKLR